MELTWKKTIRTGLAAVILSLFLSFCGGCMEQNSLKLIHKDDLYDPYPKIALCTMSGYQLEKQNTEFFHKLAGGNVLECFDAQALPAIEQGAGMYWYPQCLATVVIVADRSQTGQRIEGWKDLLQAGVEVGWNGNLTSTQLIFGAFAYGLEGADFTKNGALELLRKQNEAGCFQEDNWGAPWMVCFDYQAVALIRQGRNLEIIIPKEGTLSYTLGMLSNQFLHIPSDDMLLDGGMRLLDGRCKDFSYPPAEQYLRAEQLHNFIHLLKETSYIVRDIQRDVQNTRMYSPADGREHILVTLIGIVTAILWMSSAMQRSIRPDLQKAVKLFAVLIVGWLALRLFKYQLYEQTMFNRMVWYSYYAFLLALPLIMMYIAAVFDRPDPEQRSLRWMYPFIGAYIVIMGLIFTNDWHHWIFEFYTVDKWFENYSYNTGFLMIYLFGSITFLISVGFFIRKSWKSPNRLRWIFPILLVVLVMVYSTCYSLGIPLARDSDFIITICCFSILFFETALQTGLIPSNTRYDLLFKSSPLSMQLLDKKGKIVLASSSARVLEPVLRLQLQSRPSVSVSRDENTLLFARAIHDGTVVWQEDISTLNHLHQEIQDSVKKMEAANTLLRKEGAVRRQRLAAEVKAQLFNSLALEIKAKTVDLTRAIEELPFSEDRSRQIAYITLMLCHIKRRCNLFFLTQEGRDMDGDELAIYLDELSEFAGYAGVNALTRCGVSGAMDIRLATLCYDFYFEALAWSVHECRATLLGQLEMKNQVLDFRILSSEEAGKMIFSDSFLQAVEETGGHVAVRMLEETAGIYLTFPGGEIRHG